MYSIIKYNTDEGQKLADKVMNRNRLDLPEIQAAVDDILRDVKERGDEALFEYSEKFDKAHLTTDNIRVSQSEIDTAYGSVSPRLLEVIRHSIRRISDFHEAQKHNSWIKTSEDGTMLGQLVMPVESAGVYVPGGEAAYPSSVLMNVIPAKIAGVKRIVMTMPLRQGVLSDVAVVAAVEAGVTEIYKVGGAQAIGALAYGTESIPRVDKIVGPGNIYVALAKKSVFGYVGIDSVAGPSEIVVIADKSADPEYTAADLLSQAEHNEMACAILITDSERLANEVHAEALAQAERLPRRDTILKSLNDYGAVIVVNSLEQAAEVSNAIAPEHLELAVSDPFSLLGKIKNAGAIFLGHYTPEPLGDYMAGPNHVLPTGGTARFFSPLSVDDFVKKSSLLSFSKQAMLDLGNDVIDFARAEGFEAHANSIKVRMDREN